MINWGANPLTGDKRLPCPEKPELLKGAPIGMYHCPYCGEMQIAGIEHLPPDKDYELVFMDTWPAGYEK